jgi:cell division protein FtsW (lipid II flippase)
MTPAQRSQEALRDYREAKRREGMGTRKLEMACLLLGALVVAAVILRTASSKGAEFVSLQTALDAHRIVNLNSTVDTEKLIPFLAELPGEEHRRFVAQRIAFAARLHSLSNVGALGKLWVTRADLEGHSGLEPLKRRLTDEVNRRQERERERLADRSWMGAALDWLRAVFSRAGPEVSVPLITAKELRNLKPLLVVRTPSEFRKSVFSWLGWFVLSLFAVHATWRVRRFTGDQAILPVLLLMTGIGFALMISLRDPVRDNLLFADFAQGVIGGAAAMIVFSAPNYDVHLRRYRFLFLLGALALGLALAIFGSGPTNSDAKVNLFFFHPVEVIRILIALFLAGYFAEHWSMLRDLRERSGWLASRLRMPRRDYVLPVTISVAMSLGLFVFLKDNGPALVAGSLFLVLYAIARKRVLGALAGFGCIAGAFYFAHALHWPLTVAQRVDMWRAPWRNLVSGGDQVAHSFWSFATGGAWGAGLGRGSAASIPAGYTDLILSVGAEQLGFAGILCIFALYAFLVWRCFRIALRSPSAYSFFLAMGLILSIVLQLILIAGGVLGLMPLSGVVSPLLSFGKSSMVSNFTAFAMILAVSSRGTPESGLHKRNFGRPVLLTALLLGVCGAAILGRAAYFQLAAADETMVRDAEVRFGDGSVGLAYNPRIREVLHLLAKGNIVDRDGLPLASSHWETIVQHKAQYAKLGVAISDTPPPNDSRYYPLGPSLFYLVGDLRSTLHSGAPNTAFLEQRSRTRLQGFDDRREVIELEDPLSQETYRVLRKDYSDLIPLLRHRYDPTHPAVAALLERNRDVKMSIAAQFQLRVSEILKKHLEPVGHKGAIVVVEPESGDLLAAASYPWPGPQQFEAFRANPDRTMEADLLDRARFGLYPPGSSFKIVTAIAALRLDPANASRPYECKALGDGRVGNYAGPGKRPIRDDEMDHVPHGTVTMAKGITVSCNAYFAQLGYDAVGSKALLQTANLFGISTAKPNTAEQLRKSLSQASYGQGQVVVTPFQMARVAATIANRGKMPQGRWVIDESNPRSEPLKEVLDTAQAEKIAEYMRMVVSAPGGTGRVLQGMEIPVAGKTGTAELQSQPAHAWFIGFAPYEGGGKKIAFAVLVENGRYGGRTAAPIAGEVVRLAKEMGLL